MHVLHYVFVYPKEVAVVSVGDESGCRMHRTDSEETFARVLEPVLMAGGRYVGC